MDDLNTPLEKICGDVKGAVAACVMAADGIPVSSVEAPNNGTDTDWSSLLVEYSAALTQVKQSTEAFEAGDLEELSVRSQRLTTIIRPLNSDYFVALALLSTGNIGKGRYLLRLHAGALAQALS